MKNVVIYTTKICPFCIKAKHLLKTRNIPFVEHVYSFGSKEMDDLIQRTNHLTVPQIFFGDDFIGGCDDLERVIRSGQLENKLADE